MSPASKALVHNVTLIPGDGVGPEVIEAARRCLEATGVRFQWEVINAGEAALKTEGSLLPDRLLESIRRNKVALKGPTTTPVGTGFRSVNVALRKALDLYACLRPCRHYPGVPAHYQGVDIVVVRENTEDLYVGIEFDQGTPEASQAHLVHRADAEEKLRRRFRSGREGHLGDRQPPHRPLRLRLCPRQRPEEVTAVHKANI